MEIHDQNFNSIKYCKAEKLKGLNRAIYVIGLPKVTPLGNDESINSDYSENQEMNTWT